MPCMHDTTHLKDAIRQKAANLGFAHLGVTDTDLSAYEADYFNWLGHHYHGEMGYMVRHGVKRTRPNLLVPGTVRILSLRMPYYSREAANPIEQLQQPEQAYIARYALNRDYHKLIRKRLKELVAFIHQLAPGFNYRIFTDSAPVLERPIGEKAGLGFIGKNSLLIHPRAGSWFFLAEIFTDLDLPLDPPFEKNGCGPCTACMAECPTGAIVADGVVDARRCISYLTIEHEGDIPEALRPLMGNRIYGCDDCQLVCPWNRFGECSHNPAWQPRHHLDNIRLLDLWQWDEETFLKNFEGSPIRRIGYERWRRNLAVALGNAPYNKEIVKNLSQTIDNASEMVKRHILWALEQQQKKREKSGEKKNRGTPFPTRVRKAHLPKDC
ncbi:MAG TPA: tRNA epoxyqueuosine(34) reductase QueG [Sulfurivirga caldicuralii]|nr:tRNA epoxyqueuosine(34) reductase QueG [Sulfurivirga caldicuralii]